MSFQVASGSPPPYVAESSQVVGQYFTALPTHILAHINWAGAAALVFAGFIAAIVFARFLLSNASE
ncbi:hypothetical protein D3C72_387250 [compost metagenome]